MGIGFPYPVFTSIAFIISNIFSNLLKILLNGERSASI